jgi:hypothetical protein
MEYLHDPSFDFDDEHERLFRIVQFIWYAMQCNFNIPLNDFSVILVIWLTYYFIKICCSYKNLLRRHKNFFVLLMVFGTCHDISRVEGLYYLYFRSYNWANTFCKLNTVLRRHFSSSFIFL